MSLEKVEPDEVNRREDFAKPEDCYCCRNKHPQPKENPEFYYQGEFDCPDGEELCFDCNFANCLRADLK